MQMVFVADILIFELISYARWRRSIFLESFCYINSFPNLLSDHKLL